MSMYIIYGLNKTPKNMKNEVIYEVLPFTFNYGDPIFNLLRVFRTQYEAYRYANEFKWVEIQTIMLDEVINEHLNTINPL